MLTLLDRDGVINHDLPTGILRREDFTILQGIPEAIARLTAAGQRVAICTNQASIGRGQLTWPELDAMHAHLREVVEHAGGRIDAIYVAADHPDHPSDRRKPGPGMLREAMVQFQAEAASTFFIGDALRDLQAAAAAGCPSILVRSGHGQHTEQAGWAPANAPRYIADGLPDAVDWLLSYSAGA